MNNKATQIFNNINNYIESRNNDISDILLMYEANSDINRIDLINELTEDNIVILEEDNKILKYAWFFSLSKEFLQKEMEDRFINILKFLHEWYWDEYTYILNLNYKNRKSNKWNEVEIFFKWLSELFFQLNEEIISEFFEENSLNIKDKYIQYATNKNIYNYDFIVSTTILEYDLDENSPIW